MGKFEERELVTSPTCSTCKHCMFNEVENDDGDAYSDLYINVFHCMLGVSKEERNYVQEEIADYDGAPYEASFTDTFNQIMKMNSRDRDCQYLEDSARWVREDQCCQFYKSTLRKEK